MAKAWKRGEGPSCQPGPHAERVTSSSNAHSLPAVRLCFTCRRRERWRGALLCPSWNMLSYKIKIKLCLMPSGKMSLPCEDPKCLLAGTCSFIISPRGRSSMHLPHPCSLAMTSSWTNNQGQWGNGKSILKIAAFLCFLPPPLSSSQRLVLLLDVKLMILNPRCVMLS